MKHTYQIIQTDNLVINTIIGELTYEEYYSLMLQIMNDKRFIPAMNMFWDFRAGTLSQFTKDEINKIRDFVHTNQFKRGENYRVAFLVAKEIDFGLSRMYQGISVGLPVNFSVFYDEMEAMAFIKNN